jgi:hypothetical protein
LPTGEPPRDPSVLQARRRGPLFALLLAASPLALGACGSVIERGLLGRVESGCDGAGGPVASARVQVECPGEATPRLVATSDASGHFLAPLPAAPLPMACSLTIARDGYRTRSYPVSDVCLPGPRSSGGECRAVSVAARLEPGGRTP